MVRELGVQPGRRTRELYDRLHRGSPARPGGCSSVVRPSSPTPSGSCVLGGGRRNGGAAGARPDGDREVGTLPRGRRPRTRGAAGESSPSRPRLRCALRPDRRRYRAAPVDGRASLDALPQRTRSILAELSPLARPAPPLQGAVTRHQVVAALRRALALAGHASPTVLCVEDAHVLDEATADVLHQLVAGGGGDPLLVMADLPRRVDTNQPAARHHRAHTQRPHAVDPVGPLAHREIAELVAAPPRCGTAPEDRRADGPHRRREARSSCSNWRERSRAGAAGGAAADGA